MREGTTGWTAPLPAVIVMQVVQIGKIGVIMRPECSMSSVLWVMGDRFQSNFMARRVGR